MTHVSSSSYDTASVLLPMRLCERTTPGAQIRVAGNHSRRPNEHKVSLASNA